MFAQERGLSEEKYLRRTTLRRFMLHGRAFAFKAMLPWRPVMGIFEGMGKKGAAPGQIGELAEEAQKQQRVAGSAALPSAFTKSQPRDRLPGWFQPMGNPNPVDLDGPLGSVLAAASAMVK